MPTLDEIKFSRKKIYDEVVGVIEEALIVNPKQKESDNNRLKGDFRNAILVRDFGAESADYSGIAFGLESVFHIKILRSELFPEDFLLNKEYVEEGRFTNHGLDLLRNHYSHFDLTEFEKSPRVELLPDLYTVGSLANYVENKLKSEERLGKNG